MKADQRTARFTGAHMLAIMVGFFGVIITVNVTMATFANTSWTGLVVENSYVASQQFNEKLAATREQAALGWKSTLSVEGGKARFSLRDGSGRAVALREVILTFKHPVGVRDDIRIILSADGRDSHNSDEAVADGTWLVDIEADTGRTSPYRETQRIQIRQGSRS